MMMRNNRKIKMTYNFAGKREREKKEEKRL